MSTQRTEPTPIKRADRDNTPADWLSPAAREQLARDLDDLPELADQLSRHYDALLAKGSRDERDKTVRYVIEPGVLDLADVRAKDGIELNPIDAGDCARRNGGRRTGVLVVLGDWVRLADGEMWDLGIEHGDTASVPTVTTEAGWLARHLAWIGGQQWVTEMAGVIRSIVADLESHVGPAYAAPDPTTVGTVTELAALTGIPAGTIYRWSMGRLTLAGKDDKGRRLYFRREVVQNR